MAVATGTVVLLVSVFSAHNPDPVMEKPRTTSGAELRRRGSGVEAARVLIRRGNLRMDEAIPFSNMRIATLFSSG